MDWPEARTTGGIEVHLDTYVASAKDDLLGQVVMERTGRPRHPPASLSNERWATP